MSAYLTTITRIPVKQITKYLIILKALSIFFPSLCVRVYLIHSYWHIHCRWWTYISVFFLSMTKKKPYVTNEICSGAFVPFTFQRITCREHKKLISKCDVIYSSLHNEKILKIYDCTLDFYATIWQKKRMEHISLNKYLDGDTIGCHHRCIYTMRRQNNNWLWLCTEFLEHWIYVIKNVSFSHLPFALKQQLWWSEFCRDLWFLQ